MTNDNLAVWEKFADIDPKFTKPITGKSYRGTSPNPQYVVMCLTELFGPVGKGFGWEVVSEGFTPLGEEILHWCRIHFWHGDRSQWFESYGQTKALMKTKNGLMSDEDAPKKSLTDAIVKAASHIGIAANIFLGRWDDQKYVAEVDKEYRQEEREEQKPKKQDKPISAAEQKRQLLEIDKDLLDANTYADVKRCAEVWQSITTRDGWSRDYKLAAKEKFDARREAIHKDATVSNIEDEFPGSTTVDERYHPLNAG